MKVTATTRTMVAAMTLLTLSCLPPKSNDQQATADANKGSGNSETNAGENGDTPEKPAPIAGAYLWYPAPALAKSDPDGTANLAFQLRTKDGHRVTDAEVARGKWSLSYGRHFDPKKYSISVVMLTNLQPRRYFHGYFKIKPRTTVASSTQPPITNALSLLGTVEDIARRPDVQDIGAAFTPGGSTMTVASASWAVAKKLFVFPPVALVSTPAGVIAPPAAGNGPATISFVPNLTGSPSLPAETSGPSTPEAGPFTQADVLAVEEQSPTDYISYANTIVSDPPPAPPPDAPTFTQDPPSGATTQVTPTFAPTNDAPTETATDTATETATDTGTDTGTGTGTGTSSALAPFDDPSNGP